MTKTAEENENGKQWGALRSQAAFTRRGVNGVTVDSHPAMVIVVNEWRFMETRSAAAGLQTINLRYASRGFQLHSDGLMLLNHHYAAYQDIQGRHD